MKQLLDAKNDLLDAKNEVIIAKTELINRLEKENQQLTSIQAVYQTNRSNSIPNSSSSINGDRSLISKVVLNEMFKRGSDHPAYKEMRKIARATLIEKGTLRFAVIRKMNAQSWYL